MPHRCGTGWWNHACVRCKYIPVQRKPVRRLAAATLLAVLVAACTRSSSGPTGSGGRTIASHVVVLGLAWVASGIYAVEAEDPVDVDSTILVRVDDPQREHIPVRLETECNVSRLFGLESLANGSLLYGNECRVPFEAPPGQDRVSFHSLDPGTGADSLVAEVNERVGAVTWDSSSETGIGGTGTRCGYLASIHDGTVQAMDLQIQVGSETWGNDPVAQSSGNSQCPFAPANALPSFSPDRDHVAFMSSGPTDDERTWGLFVAPASGGHADLIADGFGDPGDLEWSPDGSSFAVTAERGGEELRSLWIVDATSGAIRLVTTGAYGPIAWAPDSRQIVATIDADPDSFSFPNPVDVTLFDVAE